MSIIREKLFRVEKKCNMIVVTIFRLLWKKGNVYKNKRGLFFCRYRGVIFIQRRILLQKKEPSSFSEWRGIEKGKWVYLLWAEASKS